MRNDQSHGEQWLDMGSGTLVTVSASANFVVKWAINLVFFCAKDTR